MAKEKVETKSAPDFSSIYANYISDIVTECAKADGLHQSRDDGHHVRTR